LYSHYEQASYGDGEGQLAQESTRQKVPAEYFQVLNQSGHTIRLINDHLQSGS